MKKISTFLLYINKLLLFVIELLIINQLISNLGKLFGRISININFTLCGDTNLLEKLQ